MVFPHLMRYRLMHNALNRALVWESWNSWRFIVAECCNPLSVQRAVSATYFTLDGLDPNQAIDAQ